MAYGSQLTLKFAKDERRLDVAGSHNVRYEIVKKRIDRSSIKYRKERLTQPEHIAFVYNREREVTAYRRYFEYLLAEGSIYQDWEELELEPLQGVEGLRALRAKVSS